MWIVSTSMAFSQYLAVQNSIQSRNKCARKSLAMTIRSPAKHAGKERYGSMQVYMRTTAALQHCWFDASVGVFASLAAVMSAIQQRRNTANVGMQ
jgi:hypothetical protein